ncbi:hypothetical protein Tco_0200189 [Tanacetum coccineum]
MACEWLKFNTHDFLQEIHKEFRNNLKDLLKKEIKGLEALDYADFSIADTLVFQLGGVRRSMTMRKFILALGLYTEEDAREKVTLEDLFLLHNIDEGDRVDVPWTISKFLTDKAKGAKKKSMIVGAYLIGRIAKSYGLMAPAYMRVVTLGQETWLLNVAKLVDLDICRYNRLGMGELVDDKLDNSEDEAAAAKAREAQEQEGVMISFMESLDRLEWSKKGFVTRTLATWVQQGVNFMSIPQIFSTAPTTSPNPFGLFNDAGAGPSTSHNHGNDMDEE